jgi:hypothetical protein
MTHISLRDFMSERIDFCHVKRHLNASVADEYVIAAELLQELVRDSAKGTLSLTCNLLLTSSELLPESYHSWCLRCLSLSVFVIISLYRCGPILTLKTEMSHVSNDCRCYIALTQATDMSYGATLIGPAGTGKTETLRDLSRCLGKYFINVTCSDQINCRAFTHIVAGLTVHPTVLFGFSI